MDENSIRDNILKKIECMSDINEALEDTNNRLNTIIAAIIAAIVAIVVSVSSSSFENSVTALLILISCVIIPFVYFCFDLFVLNKLEKLRELLASESLNKVNIRNEYARLKKYSKIVGMLKYTFVFLVSIATVVFLISKIFSSEKLL